MIDFLCVTTEGLTRRTCGAAAALPQSGPARGRRCRRTQAARGRKLPQNAGGWAFGPPRVRRGALLVRNPVRLGGTFDVEGRRGGALLARLPHFCWYWVASLMGCALAYQTCHPIADCFGHGGQGQAPSEPAAGEKGERTAEWTASSGKQSPPPSARPDDGPGEMPPRGMAARGRFYASSSAARERL